MTRAFAGQHRDELLFDLADVLPAEAHRKQVRHWGPGVGAGAESLIPTKHQEAGAFGHGGPHILQLERGEMLPADAAEDDDIEPVEGLLVLGKAQELLHAIDGALLQKLPFPDPEQAQDLRALMPTQAALQEFELRPRFAFDVENLDRRILDFPLERPLIVLLDLLGGEWLDAKGIVEPANFAGRVAKGDFLRPRSAVEYDFGLGQWLVIAEHRDRGHLVLEPIRFHIGVDLAHLVHGDDLGRLDIRQSYVPDLGLLVKHFAHTDRVDWSVEIPELFLRLARAIVRAVREQQDASQAAGLDRGSGRLQGARDEGALAFRFEAGDLVQRQLATADVKCKESGLEDLEEGLHCFGRVVDDRLHLRQPGRHIRMVFDAHAAGDIGHDDQEWPLP